MIEKWIYFPKNGNPAIIFITAKWRFEKVYELQGCFSEEGVLDGRFQFFPEKHCHPYSQELWDACMHWAEKRDALKKEYEQLMIKGLPHDQ